MSPIEATTPADLKQLASDVVARALKAGATDAEAVVYEGDEFSALVRLGQVETLKESGSRAVGLRVFIGQRTASTSSSRPRAARRSTRPGTTTSLTPHSSSCRTAPYARTTRPESSQVMSARCGGSVRWKPGRPTPTIRPRPIG